MINLRRKEKWCTDDSVRGSVLEH